MSGVYFVGQLVQLSTTVTDLTGAEADATVTLTVTDPTGTTSTPSPTHVSTGHYSATFTVDAAGTWRWRWVAAGAVVSADEGQVEVVAQRALVAPFDKLKEALNRTDTDDDDELRDYLIASTEVVEELTGVAIGVQTFTEYHHAAGGLISVNRSPITGVTSITPDYVGAAAIDSTLYTVDTDANVILCRFATRERLCVVYPAGLTVIPARYRRAGLIIAQHLWMVENGGGGAPVPGGTTMVPGLGFAVPNRAIELLGSSHSFSGIA